MTKEELEKEATDYAEKHAFRVPYDGSNKFYDDVDFKASEEGYLAGAEPREKRIEELEGLLINSKRLSDTIEKAQKKQIAELEAQIEEMKCLLNEIYSEFGFSELVKIRNDLPLEIQEVIKEITKNGRN